MPLKGKPRKHKAGEVKFRGDRNAGTGIADVWDFKGQVDAGASVDDERRGQVTCRKCGQEIMHVEVEGKWKVRNTDGLPHTLTCGE